MSHNTTQNPASPNSKYTSIFDQALQDTAEHLGVNPEKLLVWFGQYPLMEVPTQLRFLHLIKKLPGVSRQAFNIATLSLGINRIKSQRRLP